MFEVGADTVSNSAGRVVWPARNAKLLTGYKKVSLEHDILVW